MNEVMMVPVHEFNRLQDYYKGKITQSALLSKAGRLAAEEDLILKDKRIPASMAVKMTKPMANEEVKLVKRIRTGIRGTPTYQGTIEPEGMADAPVERLLKQIMKGVNQPPAAPVVIKQEPVTPSVKREKKTPKPFSSFEPVTLGKTPISSTGKKVVSKKEGLKKKSGVGKAAKGFLKSLLEDDEGGYSPKGKAKKYKKAKPTTFEQLQAGWENWDAPPRRKLGYDTQ